MTKRLKSKHKVDRRLKANLGEDPKARLTQELILQVNMVKKRKTNRLWNSASSKTKAKSLLWKHK